MKHASAKVRRKVKSKFIRSLLKMEALMQSKERSMRKRMDSKKKAQKPESSDSRAS